MKTVLLLLAVLRCSQAYYLPGTYPQEFVLGQNLQGGQPAPPASEAGWIQCWSILLVHRF
jgi:hypothetical protein